MTKHALSNFNQFVDTVQDAKVKFVDTFVFDDTIRQNLVSFIEAQRTFVKTTVKGVTETVEYSTGAMHKAFETAVKSAK